MLDINTTIMALSLFICLQWILVAKLEDIYALYTEGKEFVRLEVTGFPNGYRMQFERQTELESFITYLAGYIRYLLFLLIVYAKNKNVTTFIFKIDIKMDVGSLCAICNTISARIKEFTLPWTHRVRFKNFKCFK